MSLEFGSSPHVEAIGKLTGHKARVSAMAWSPNGEWLASCSLDGVLNLWSSLSAKNRPRFTRQAHTAAHPALTSVAWSHDGRYLACGSAAGWLEIWEAGTFQSVNHADAGAKSAIKCVAWSPEKQVGDLRLAFGGGDRIVHFRNYRDWNRPDTERGIGHIGSILSIAWSPDGGTLVTGTEEGTIGVWEPSGLDNQLRDVLDWTGFRAHSAPVRTLAWSADTDILASGASDLRVHLWSVKDRALIDEFVCQEEVLDVEFALKGKLLVVQTRDHIRFLRPKPLREIAAYYSPAALDSTTDLIALDATSRLAAVDPDDQSTIDVWRIDFDGLLRESEVTRRSFAAVSVPLLGESASGKTNLALTLTHKPFTTKHVQPPFSVHMLPAPTVEQKGGIEEIHEIAFWDLASHVNHALVQRIHTGDGLVALIVLDPIPGTVATAADNLDRWRQTLRRWKDLPRRHRLVSLVVITKCDQLRLSPTDADSRALAEALGFAVVFTSAKTGLGVADLRAAIVDAVNWPAATAFVSVEAFEHLREFVRELRGEQRYLTSTRELYDAFLRMHPFLKEYIPDDREFKRGTRLLEVIGEAQVFEGRDEILLDPAYYHAYAAAMIAGARKDETGMGRLPLEEAELGRGRHIEIDESERLSDSTQEARLLGLTIHELVRNKGVAQIVSTDGVSHLVFPMSLVRVRDAAEPTPARATGCQFAGAVDDIFSSLVVRLLGLTHHYPKFDLWKNEARFIPSSGGCCGVVVRPNNGGDEAELSLYFDDATKETEQLQFADLVRGHIVARARSMSGELEKTYAPMQAAKHEGSRQEIEVYFSWRSDEADAITAQNAGAIATQLKARGIRVLGESVNRLGDTRQEHLAHVQKSRVALFLLARPMSKAQEVDYYRLEASGCRIIPVILPNARKTFVLPALLRRWVHIDFRGKFLDVETLAHGITEAWTAGPIKATRSEGHVFLSYFRNDADRVAELRQALESAGHHVWWDQGNSRLRPGTYWDREIKQAIRDSYAFILCVSELSMARSRSGVYPEVMEAIELQRSLHPAGIFIIPVRLSECDVPAMQIDATRNLSALQYFDYFDRDAHLAELVSVLDGARAEANAGSR